MHAVDIVVPVFNALTEVKACLYSLMQHRLPARERLIVVDDCSSAETHGWLDHYLAQQDRCQLIRNPENLGYTRSANVGMRTATAPYIVLLNSDTVVTDGWLEALLRAIDHAPDIGIAGPLSNAAGWQNIPQLFTPDGTYCINSLPEGMELAEVARRVRSVATRRYPIVPMLNGFCLLIRRAVIDQIGLFDEENFPIGYGEETDLCIRSSVAGFRLCVADDSYVFHAKSRSFGHARRHELALAGDAALRKKHGDASVDRIMSDFSSCRELASIRERVRAVLPRSDLSDTPGIENPAGNIGPILFVLSVGAGGGGGHSVIQEATAMRAMGVDVRVAVIHSGLSTFLNTYEDVSGIASLLVGYRSLEELYFHAWRYKIVIATIYSSAALVAEIARRYPHIQTAYYVQDYEPLFFPPDSPDHRQALASYTLLPNALLFAKTWWLVDELLTRHPTLRGRVHKVQPSIDVSLYHCIKVRPPSKLRIVAMIRPDSPRRGAERTLRTLGHIQHRYPKHCIIHTFGCAHTQLSNLASVSGFHYCHHGVLNRPQVARLLQRCAVFVDFSDYQAFGRTALEAMASGATAIVPASGGANEFALDRVNSLVIDTTNESSCIDALTYLVENPDQLDLLRANAKLTASQYSAATAASSEVALFAAHSTPRNWFRVLFGGGRALCYRIIRMIQRVSAKLRNTP